MARTLTRGRRTGACGRLALLRADQAPGGRGAAGSRDAGGVRWPIRGAAQPPPGWNDQRLGLQASVGDRQREGGGAWGRLLNVTSKGNAFFFFLSIAFHKYWRGKYLHSSVADIFIKKIELG